MNDNLNNNDNNFIGEKDTTICIPYSQNNYSNKNSSNINNNTDNNFNNSQHISSSFVNKNNFSVSMGDTNTYSVNNKRRIIKGKDFSHLDKNDLTIFIIGCVSLFFPLAGIVGWIMGANEISKRKKIYGENYVYDGLDFMNIGYICSKVITIVSIVLYSILIIFWILMIIYNMHHVYSLR